MVIQTSIHELVTNFKKQSFRLVKKFNESLKQNVTTLRIIIFISHLNTSGWIGKTYMVKKDSDL